MDKQSTTMTREYNDIEQHDNDKQQVEKEIILNPIIFTSSPPKQCGMHSTYLGSYWKLACSKKDGENPLRSKSYVDSPHERFCSYAVMDTSIEDLEVIT